MLRVKTMCFALGLLCANFAWADYPDRAVTLVVPYAAGGPTDRVARDFAEALRKQLGKPIVIENSGGAGGNIGASKVAASRPDGYTLLFHNIALATAPSLYRRLSYRPLQDFEYLGMVVDVPMVLVGRKSLPMNSLADLRVAIASKADTLNIGNAGVGSAAHLCSILLQSSGRGKLQMVPYKGTANAFQDLLGGQIDLLCDQTTSMSSYIAAGTVKTFGVTAKERLNLPGLSDKPTMQEGGLPNVNIMVWHGLYAPKGTPPAILQTVNHAVRAALKDAAFQRQEAALGAVIVTDERVTSERHKAFVAAEIDRWGAVIKENGIAPE